MAVFTLSSLWPRRARRGACFVGCRARFGLLSFVADACACGSWEGTGATESREGLGGRKSVMWGGWMIGGVPFELHDGALNVGEDTWNGSVQVGRTMGRRCGH